MRLHEGLQLSPGEARVARARAWCEASAPRMGFQYGRAQNDPAPDVLVLGNWQHPSSGNQLLGGINLNYLNQQQVQQLRQQLTQIMRGRDLKQRYDIGKRLAPEIFNRYYRTYNTEYINQVQPSELTSWSPRDTVKGLWQRAKQAFSRQPDRSEPAMQPPPGPQRPGRRPPIEPTPGAIPQAAAGPAAGAPPPDPKQQLGAQVAKGNAEIQRLAQMQRQRAQQLQQLQSREAQAQAAQHAQQELAQQQARNRQELLQPPDQEDPLAVAPLPMGETIQYWSPALGRLVTEWVEL